MKKKLKIFISSVQKELENERIAASEIITTDSFLNSHCKPVLYEYEPAYSERAITDALEYVSESDVFIILIWNEYGYVEKGLSITHHEYRQAKKSKIPVLVYIKGTRERARVKSLKDKLLKEIKKDGYKYKRFSNYKELQTEIRASLVKILKKQHDIVPSPDENKIAEQTIEATSDFGIQKTNVSWDSLNLSLAKKLVGEAGKISTAKSNKSTIRESLFARGLLWNNPETVGDYAVAAAVLLLSDNPAEVFPHCRILAGAYRSNQKNVDPYDQDDICDPLPVVIERAVEFVQRNTRHPMKIIGLDRVQLDEYPVEALREVIVNAVAHRKYELQGQKIFLTVFSDRVVVASPGLPPEPITLAKIRSGKYMPCSRNPLIAHNLSFFHRIEERGSGIGRIKDEMLDHGLDPPQFESNSGFFEVILPGPGEDLSRLRAKPRNITSLITPSIEGKLNSRQKQMAMFMLKGNKLTSRICEKKFKISRDTSSRDFKYLISLGLIEAKGKGRSRYYVIKEVK